MTGLHGGAGRNESEGGKNFLNIQRIQIAKSTILIKCLSEGIHLLQASQKSSISLYRITKKGRRASSHYEAERRKQNAPNILQALYSSKFCLLSTFSYRAHFSEKINFFGSNLEDIKCLQLIIT